VKDKMLIFSNYGIPIKPGAHTVNVSGHPEILKSNLIFSKLRELPYLKTLIIKNIPDNFINRESIKCIFPEQIFKYIEKRINIVSEQWLIEEFKKIVKNLIINRKNNIDKRALQMVENYFTTTPISEEIHLLNDEIEVLKLLHDYHTGKGVFSDPAIQKSNFFINRPLFRWPDSNEYGWVSKALFNLYVTITATDLWDVVKKGTGDAGLNLVYCHPLVLSDNHRGNTLDFCMRAMENIANHGLSIQEQYTQNEQVLYLSDLDAKIEKIMNLLSVSIGARAVDFSDKPSPRI
jgi:hypothetical protein